MFAVYLSKGAGSVGNIKFGKSLEEMDLGKYSKASNPGDIVWMNVVDDGWTIPMNGVEFREGEKLHLKSE